MFADFIIGAVVVSMFSYGLNNINTQQVKTAVIEKERAVTMSMMTYGLSYYYYSHNKEYPDVINHDVLVIMGLQGLDLTGFEYLKLADGTYSFHYVPGSKGNITGHAGAD
mgnify:CR=1 FL=1